MHLGSDDLLLLKLKPYIEFSINLSLKNVNTIQSHSWYESP